MRGSLQLQTRPAGNVKTVKDVLVNDCGPRTILSGKVRPRMHVAPEC